MAYTTEQKVKDYLQIDNFTHSGTSGALPDWIDAVEEWIDNYCGRTFENEITTRLYDGNGKSEIITDDFTTLTEISLLDEDGDVDDNTTDSTDWFTKPANSKPKTAVKLNPQGQSMQITFPKGTQNVKLHGDFGYETSVPKAVEMAATMLVAELVKNHDQGSGDMKAESLADYSVTYADVDRLASELNAMAFLEQLKRVWV